MIQDYRHLTDEQIELIEKQTLRVIVQALQEYSREAKDIFENTSALTGDEITNLSEDLVQYALEVAELYPINKRFAGSIDYKRVRWLPTSFGLFPQALLVDAKASTENNRDTLQQSQLPMDAEFSTRQSIVTMKAGVPSHMDVQTRNGSRLPVITTSIFVHFYYEVFPTPSPMFRSLKSIFALSLPHQRLKHIYNPNPSISFFGQGKHSPARGEAQRIRVYYSPLRQMCPWRLQELKFEGAAYSTPLWRDIDPTGSIETQEPFSFIGR